MKTLHILVALIACCFVYTSASACMPFGNQRDTITQMINTIRDIQRQVNGKRYGAGADRYFIWVWEDNFKIVNDSTFAYRLTTSKPGVVPVQIREQINFSHVKSIRPLPISTDGIGAIAVDFSKPTPTTVLFYYIYETLVTSGKLLTALLDLTYAVNKAKGVSLDELYSDWKELVERGGTHESISQFIDKHPDSFLTDFAKMIAKARDN